MGNRPAGSEVIHSDSRGRGIIPTFGMPTRPEFGGLSVTYGLTANNNPTVQDPWNTTPAWGFPYVASPFNAGFGPTPIIDGAFAQHVASFGAYAFINDALYLEASMYGTLSPSAQVHLGTDPFGAPGQIDGAAPYWRVAFEPHWGNSWLEVGTFGMYAKVNPWSSPPSAARDGCACNVHIWNIPTDR